MKTIFRNNLRRIFKSPIRLAVLLIIPLLFMNLFIPKDYEVPFKVGFIDEDCSTLTMGLREKLASCFDLVETAEEEVSAAVVSRELDYALIIRKGFAEEFLRTGNVAVEGYGVSGPNVAMAVNSILNSYMNAVQRLATDPDAFESSLLAFLEGAVKVSYLRVDEASRLRTLGVLGFLVQFMIYMSVITSGLLLEERGNRSLYRILSAPVDIKQYMGGHMLSAAFVAVVQVVVIFAAMKYAMGIYFEGFFLSLMLLYVLFALVCVCMGLLVTSYCKTARQAYIAIVLLATPLVMLGGAYWPRDFMPEILIRISNLLPTTWVLEASRKLINGGSLASIASEVAILCAFAAVFFAGGVLRKVDIAK